MLALSSGGRETDFEIERRNRRTVTSGVPATGKGDIARVREASPGRYTLMLSSGDVPGRGRVYFAYSLGRLAELFKLSVTGMARAQETSADQGQAAA